MALKSEGQERLPDFGSSSPFDNVVRGLLLNRSYDGTSGSVSYPLTFTLRQFASSYILAGTTVITK